MANKAYKFRLYPTKEQERLLAKTFGCVRFVYNQMLADRKETYEQYKDNKEALKKQKFPIPAKYKNKFPWLKEVDSLALANAQLNLQKAYQNFFAGRTEFPKFKSRKARQSYTTNVVNGNNAWGMFTAFLRYKLEEQGKKLIQIDRWFPSSKTCSCCGQVKESLSLCERTFRCPCGFAADRDWNASINIKNEGIRMLA